MAELIKTNEKTCPFCGNNNQCMANSATSCWCNKISIPTELISLLAKEKQGKYCICQSCIQLFKKDPKAFEKFQ